MNVDEEAARDAVAKHTDATAERLECERFNDGVNTTFAVQPAACSGPEYVVKYGTSDPDGVQTEAFILIELSSTIPVPQVYGWEQTDPPYFVASFVEGEQPPYPTRMEQQRRTNLARKIGALLARVHEMTLDGVGRVVHNGTSGVQGAEETSNWRLMFRQVLDRMANDAKKTFAAQGREAVRLVHYGEMPTLSHEPTLVPVDMHTHNLIVDGETDEVRAAIDFERCFAGHRRWGYEVVKHILSPEEHERIVEAFRSGYSRVAGDVPEAHPLFRLAGILREMRAAHMWWESPEQHAERLTSQLDAVEQRLDGD